MSGRCPYPVVVKPGNRKPPPFTDTKFPLTLPEFPPGWLGRLKINRGGQTFGNMASCNFTIVLKGRHWKKSSNSVQERLRQNGATILYVYKSPVTWLKSQKGPFLLGAIEVKHNFGIKKKLTDLTRNMVWTSLVVRCFQTNPYGNIWTLRNVAWDLER